jgi:phage shock protein E
MKKIILVTISIIFGGLVLFFIFAPTQNSQGQNTTQSKSSEINSEVSSGKAVLLDVRTPQEFSSGHSPKAVNFDSVRIDQGEMPNIPKDTKIYLYCRSGNRATQVKNTLESQGYVNVVNLGGLSQMKNMGLL